MTTKKNIDHEQRELNYHIRKRQNTAWTHDINWPFSMSGGQFAIMPTIPDFRTKPLSNKSNDVTDHRGPVASGVKSVQELEPGVHRTKITT